MSRNPRNKELEDLKSWHRSWNHKGSSAPDPPDSPRSRSSFRKDSRPPDPPDSPRRRSSFRSPSPPRSRSPSSYRSPTSPCSRSSYGSPLSPRSRASYHSPISPRSRASYRSPISPRTPLSPRSPLPPRSPSSWSRIANIPFNIVIPQVESESEHDSYYSRNDSYYSGNETYYSELDSYYSKEASVEKSYYSKGASAEKSYYSKGASVEQQMERRADHRSRSPVSDYSRPPPIPMSIVVPRRKTSRPKQETDYYDETDYNEAVSIGKQMMGRDNDKGVPFHLTIRKSTRRRR